MTFYCIFISVCVVTLDVCLLYIINTHPKTIFSDMREKALHSLDEVEPGVLKKEGIPDIEARIYIWNQFHNEATKILANKEKYLAKFIFIGGGLILFVWCLLTYGYLLQAGDTKRVSFWTAALFFVLHQPFLIYFYLHHLKHFNDYVVIGEKEEFLEELQIHLEEIGVLKEDDFA